MQTEIYKVHIEDRGYTKWTYFNTYNFQEINIDAVHPAECKLFSNDVFSIDENLNVNIIHSTIRICENIPGVLVLKSGKTYGRKNGKLLYKCVPDDRRIPTFLIPYEMKNVGFSKVYNNHYITLKFTEWKEKHPHGIISQTIGPVDILDNFYEYQLYCKSLNVSIQKFTKETSKILKSQPHEKFIENICKKYPSIEDRTDWHIFTIDPPKSLDYDDGFSIRKLENGIEQISIYISNVTIWLDFLNLWDSFSRRISTIYLPDRKRPMLPTILSDCLCSLQENNTRIAFVLDIYIEGNNIREIKHSNCKIKVFKNYCYEEPLLLGSNQYQHLMKVTKEISKKYKYVNNVRNSHDLVSYLMILMNYHSAKEMLLHKTGIFRSTIIKNEVSIPSELPEDVAKFIKIWNSSASQYIDLNSLKEGETISHNILEIDAYIHITSPIRRLVDLLNIIKFQQNNSIIPLSEKAFSFYNKWINDLEYINTTMRSIRKIQNDCSLLNLCSTNPEIMNKLYDGYVFDKIIRNDGLYQFIVFLPELKLTCRVTMRENLENYEVKKYKLYLFNDEENFKKKIRLQLIV